MYVSMKYLFYLLWLVFLYAVGILIFCKGFMLTRFVITDNNTCTVTLPPSLSTNGDSHGGGCWMPPKHKKAILIIIDALRFDFAAYNHSIPHEKLLPFQNKLKSIDKLLQDNPQNAVLYHFIADPPTTTLQRLKGLTTGSLPTFVDVASNFDSSAISEDNLIDQLVTNGKNIVFMGDDTWMSLFPSQFKRSFSYPSFNVKDLHTVDNGVLEHLEPEMMKNDWDVLIAHFLGVDHCGHRYGPNHPAMAEKLAQMDEMLNSITSSMDEDTILFVMGDHGMTKTGDHGGDSWDELHAALFVYSPTKITTTSKTKDTYKEISQIDIVPTISLLLGIPIPFPSLGSVITDLFNTNHQGTSSKPSKQELRVVETTRINAHQIRNYIQSYANRSDELPKLSLETLESIFKSAEEDFLSINDEINFEDVKLQKIKEKYIKYSSTVKKICQDIWAKFDLPLMFLGISLVVVALVLTGSWFVSFRTNTESENRVTVTGILGSTWLFCVIGVLGVLHFSILRTSILLFVCVILMFLVGGLTLYILSSKQKTRTETSFNWKSIDYISALIMFVYFASLFSNSFVVFEDTVSAFFLQSLLVYKSYLIISKIYELSSKDKFLGAKKSHKKEQKFDIGRLITSPISLVVVFTLIACVLVRISSIFRACREEQWTCEPSSFTQSLSALADDLRQLKNIRYFCTVGFIASFPILLNYWMRKYGNLNGHDLPVLCLRYVISLGVVLLALYWALQALPRKVYDNLPIWQITVFPRLIYCCAAATIISVIIQPLCVFLVYRNSKNSMPYVNPAEQVVPKMYKHIKANWRRHIHSSATSGTSNSTSPSTREEEEEPPLVYGLATVYSAAQLVLLSATVLLLLMLLGDGLAPSLLIACSLLFLILELHAAHQHVSRDKSFDIPFSSILTIGLLASEHFFYTGHQTVVTTIQWHSAFHGFHGDFDIYAIPFMLITSNTFASHILCTLALPLLLYWPLVRGNLIFLFEGQKAKENALDTKGEFVLHEDRDRLRTALGRLFVGFFMYNGIKLLATMCCAFIHRRHLMVWKIFAPRFVFEGATFLVTGPLCVLVYLFVIRVDGALAKWTKKLES